MQHALRLSRFVAKFEKLDLLPNAVKYSPNADTVVIRLAADEKQVLAGCKILAVVVIKRITERFLSGF